ncbi:hypothetical protein [Roseovarius pacificus]|uniref:hypothetical protein n=1 Tax=Roseovarius pacificus TaxID=337701 RepID=UPI00403A3089
MGIQPDFSLEFVMKTFPDPSALAEFIGHRVISETAKQRAELALRDKGKPDRAITEQYSEVVIVYPPNRDSGNKDPLVSLLEQIIIDGVVDIRIPLPPPPPLDPDPEPTDPEPPELDPCEEMQFSMDSLDIAIAADEAAIGLLEDLLKQADTKEERKSIRQQIKAAKDSIRDSKRLKKDIRQAMEDLDC